MTKEEFMGFSSAAQHDMVLEALVRVTKNLDVMAEGSGKPFVGTSKQRRNDVKLLAVLAEAFGKNELVWASAGRSKESRNDMVDLTWNGKVVGSITKDAAKLFDQNTIEVYTARSPKKTSAARVYPDGGLTPGPMFYNGVIDRKEYMEKSTKAQPWEPLPESMRRGNTGPVMGVSGYKRMSMNEYLDGKFGKNSKES